MDKSSNSVTSSNERHYPLLDVTDRYIRSATPKQGNIVFDIGYSESKHKNEIKTANWLFETFGGEIRLLRESEIKNQTTPDFLWNGKCWELKAVHSVNGADKLLQHALKQIRNNPGGVIINVLSDIELDALEEQLIRRVKRSKIDGLDLMILSKGNLAKVLRYKKREPARRLSLG